MRTPGRYGPYSTNCGHRFWHEVLSDGSTRHVYVHREMMEQHLGRKLGRDEVVHHRDGDPANNVLGNLELMSRGAHARLHGEESRSPLAPLVCADCGCIFTRAAREARRTAKRFSKSYCSRTCSGRATIAENR